MKKKRGHYYYLSRIVPCYVVLMLIVFGGKTNVLCALPWMHLVLFTAYAYKRTGVCPLEIALRVPPLRYYRTFRRMYKKRYIEMLLIYGSLPLLVLVAIASKVLLYID